MTTAVPLSETLSLHLLTYDALAKAVFVSHTNKHIVYIIFLKYIIFQKFGDIYGYPAHEGMELAVFMSVFMSVFTSRSFGIGERLLQTFYESM